jgi:hypothetical protein
MKAVAIALFALTILSVPAYAQHGEDQEGYGYYQPGYHGDTWTGEVTATNEATREITLTYRKGQKTETFTGVLDKGYKTQMDDGTVKELEFYRFRIGMRLTVYYMAAERKEAGKKIKYNRIFTLRSAPPETKK